jgi:hypothetical protein
MYRLSAFSMSLLRPESDAAVDVTCLDKSRDGSVVSVVYAGQIRQVAYHVEQGRALREDSGEVSGPVGALNGLAVAEVFGLAVGCVQAMFDIGSRFAGLPAPAARQGVAYACPAVGDDRCYEGLGAGQEHRCHWVHTRSRTFAVRLLLS